MIGSSAFPRARRVQFGAAFAALLAAAIILGWHAGAPPTAIAAAEAPAPWALPLVTPRDPAADAVILRARHPWGGRDAFRDPEVPPPPPPAATPWQLAGVIERGDQRLAFVLVGKGAAAKLEYRAVGDSLPDGSVLVQIDADSATSEGGKSAAAERRVYRLFDKAR
jgi:hypothetical protein